MTKPEGISPLIDLDEAVESMSSESLDLSIPIVTVNNFRHLFVYIFVLIIF